ncbi:MAG: CoA transferase [Chloroflexi bacterium]|nr:CoA transferase [Chloroflexota bacterium]
MLALEGIRILDLSRAAPGPFCSMILSDLGAEVIKIEAPPGASRLRAGAASDEEKRGVAYQTLSRNKKSIGLNLRSEAARRIFYQLVEQADVIIEGFRPGVVKDLGIDYETVSQINPQIVYGSISSYGQDGPYRDVIAHDLNAIAMGGALDLIGERGGRPVIPLNLVADFGGSAMCLGIGILSALIARSKTGKGQYVDISMLDSVIGLLTSVAAGYFRDNIVPKRGEGATAGAAPYYNIYETKDGKRITIGILEPWIWENFCREIGKEDFIAYQADKTKWEELSTYLTQLFLTKNRDEWFELLSRKNIFIGKVYSLDEVFTDPHVLHRQMVIVMEHPTEGKVKQVGIAVKLSDTPGAIRSRPPMLGEHTEEILAGLGYSAPRIKELRQQGAIG